MSQIVNQVEKINGIINNWVWGIPMLVLILSTGILMTVRTGFFQVVRAKIVGNETFLPYLRRKM